MSHEKLQFTLNLANKGWQPIFGNQELGTFFMIYIKIHNIEAREPNNPNTKYDYLLSYRIQNFRGSVSFGFTVFPEITLYSQANNSDIDCKISIKLSPFSLNLTYLEKTVTYNSKLEKGYTIDTNAIVGDISSEITGTETGTDPQSINYIDPRKFQRNGDTVDAIITIDEGERTILEDSLDRLNEETLRIELGELLSKGGIGGGSGICCPRRSVVI